MRTRDWFFSGVVIGLFWGLFRYPAACGCLALGVLLFVALLAVGLVATLGWAWTFLAVIGGITAIVLVKRQKPPQL